MVADDPEIEVVLSDINMPVMDGLTLLARLNEMPRVLKTVMVSAYTDLANLRVAMNRGAYDFVTKPIDFDDLEATVRKTWKEIEALHEARRTREQLEEIRAELTVAARSSSRSCPTLRNSQGRGCGGRHASRPPGERRFLRLLSGGRKKLWFRPWRRFG